MIDDPDAMAFNALTLRDYFAAHAPAEPWSHFMPVMPPPPTAPSIHPIGNEGQEPTELQERNLREWRMDGSYDIDTEPGYAKFSGWCEAWRDYHRARRERESQQWIERAEQWRWFYADTMLARRAKGRT